ncbi:MAG: VOC family protein [Polaromonas sp.]
MKNAISWFEIPSTQLDKAQAFYETVLACTLRREPMGPSEGAVFPYEGDGDNAGVGGALMAGPTAPTPAAGGTLVYLDASPSLDAALARVVQAGGKIALSRQALPPGMGFFAHITDLDGNRVGLHALS